MIKRVLVLILLVLSCAKAFAFEFTNPLKKDNDPRAKEIRYQYEVLKEDEKNRLNKRIFELTPSGYMTVDEYEALSEYKDKSTTEISVPKIETPSDFKYVPKPLYRIVKYNDPPGSVELSLGKRLYVNRQINAQGIVSPDYSMLVYPAIYYYTDSASVAADLFIIPLSKEGTNLQRILTANVAKRITEPILSTDKAIDNYAAFRTLTPVDFSPDGTKLLVKQKIGSREDGIWQTRVYIYDFDNQTSYDLVEVRDAISYFWEEYMNLRLDDKRWDIYPIGFDKEDSERIIVQGFAFTGEKPVFLGTWSIDCQGTQSRIESFNKNVDKQVSVNGYKVIQDEIQGYQDVMRQEKNLKKESKYLLKQRELEHKRVVDEIKDDYNFAVRNLYDNYKEELRDYRKLRSLAGTTEDEALQEAYKQYLIDQYNKDVQKSEKLIDKKKKEIDKIDMKLDVLYKETGDTSSSEKAETVYESEAENLSK
ncbi:MAG: hypothetical protein NC191_01190 [Muribaculaceae bacterium]|nr:hypothetical protein [Muribaculaceae bacterium]